MSASEILNDLGDAGVTLRQPTLLLANQTLDNGGSLEQMDQATEGENTQVDQTPATTAAELRAAHVELRALREICAALTEKIQLLECRGAKTAGETEQYLEMTRKQDEVLFHLQQLSMKFNTSLFKIPDIQEEPLATKAAPLDQAAGVSDTNPADYIDTVDLAAALKEVMDKLPNNLALPVPHNGQNKSKRRSATDAEGFQHQQTRKHSRAALPKGAAPSSGLEVNQNRFAVLPVEQPDKNLNVNVGASTSTGSTSFKAKFKIPPLLVIPRHEWPLLLSLCKKMAPNAFPRAQGRFQNFVVQTDDEFRKCRDYVHKVGALDHTFSLKDERPVKVVIRGLPTVTKITSITAHIAAHGYEVISNVQMTRRGTKKLLPLFYAQVKPCANIDDIYLITNLMGAAKVKIEPYAGRKGPSQC